MLRVILFLVLLLALSGRADALLLGNNSANQNITLTGADGTSCVLTGSDGTSCIVR